LFEAKTVSPANGAGAGVLAGFRSSQSQSLAEMRTHPEGRGSSVVGRFYKSRRGTAALEFVIVASVLLFSFLFPIGDLAVAGLTYIRTKEAIRELGAFAQYNPPSDLTDVSSKNWTNLPTKVGDFTVAIGTQFPTGTKTINITVSCGTPPSNGVVAGAACTSANLTDHSVPKYVWMGSKVTLSPMVLKTLTGSNISYTERLS
jgi:hypothetical protein